MLPFSVLGARRSLAGGSCREAVPFSSPSSLAPYYLPGQTAASPFRLRLRSSSSASWSFSCNQGLSFKMKIESDQSGVGPVQSGPGSDRSGPVQDRLQTGPVLGPRFGKFSVFGPVRSGPGPMNTPKCRPLSPITLSCLSLPLTAPSLSFLLPLPPPPHRHHVATLAAAPLRHLAAEQAIFLLPFVFLIPNVLHRDGMSEAAKKF
ncbi:hypothetical protein Cgig2_000398 [Carnegiea gigantea]|uniref:Uncharacterized protein n=1 Tax=Carnegiea gigantea TaxID=171969 RepID=A0A9Q1K7H0_9CARY|nr:hypothetical protein Cgig2_000398 [Carnegiea gigantea]